MQLRTDLALEQKELHSDLPNGVKSAERIKGKTKITEITIENAEGEKALKKPIGRYITIEVPPFTDSAKDEEVVQTVLEEISRLIIKTGEVLVVGLGNRKITPDALGPKTADKIFATRHIEKELERIIGTKHIRSVAQISTDVLGQTGIESFDQIKGIAEQIKPKQIVIIDALASRHLKRLGCTIQMSDSGIEPGGGVGNTRFEISKKTLGVEVLVIGIPTVVEVGAMLQDLTNSKIGLSATEGQQMIVTPKEIDLLIERGSSLLSDALNRALHQNIEEKLLKELLTL